MPKIIFMGAEIGSNRTLLESMNAEVVGISFWGIVKRGMPKTKSWLISERFDPSMKVIVESGAYQAEKAGLSKQELNDFAVRYEEFIVENFDRISAFTEFDALSMGTTWINNQRIAMMDAEDKFWPVWHAEQGPGTLVSLSQSFNNIAIPHESIEATTNLASLTQSLRRSNGTNFHALATAKPDNLRQVPFTTASTLSWLSPMRRGEVIAWDGGKLSRYPKKMRQQALPRYRTQALKAGLDVGKFLAGDNVETTKMAVWSYQRLEESMDKKKPERPFQVIEGGMGNSPQEPSDLDPIKEFIGMLSDNTDDTLYTGLTDLDTTPSDNKGQMVQQSLVARDPSETINLPVFGYQMKTIVDTDDEGRDVLREVPVVQSSGASLRQCNTCFVASNCPAFKPDNTCAFNMPIEIKTRDQLTGLLNSIIEMQGQRVAFARFGEELNGGYPDPNTGQEIDRLFKLVKTVKELDDTKETFRLTMERQSSGGVLSAIFGDRAQALRDLDNGGYDENQTTRIIQQSIED